MSDPIPEQQAQDLERMAASLQDDSRFYHWPENRQKAAQQVAALQAGARALRIQGEWQPMETAPRDGSVFWAYGEHYIDADFTPQGTFECCFDADHFVGAIWNGQSDIWNTLHVDPTYWRPLPDPPAALPRLPERRPQENDHDDQSRPLNPSVISGPDQAATETEAEYWQSSPIGLLR